MPTKLIIKTKEPGEINNNESWSELNIHLVIGGIEIQHDTPNEKTLSEVISGYPTPLARANVFEYALIALKNSNNPNSDSLVLLNYYRGLIDEWKGMIAAFVLSPDSFEAKKINLCYSHETQDLNKVPNLYEVKGAIGNMLFESKENWLSEDEKIPFLELIKYKYISKSEGEKQVVVGGTSPKSLIFTAPGYEIDEDTDVVYINKKTKKFSDPLNNSNIKKASLQVLRSYLERIIHNLSKKELNLTGLTVDEVLGEWKKEIDKRIVGVGDSRPVNNEISIFKASPFSDILNNSNELYIKTIDGTIYSSETEIDGIEKFNPKDLLLDDKEVKIAEISIDKLAELPIHVLKAGNTESYFALPLTVEALKIFGNKIGSILNPPKQDSTKITANQEGNTIKVELSLYEGEKLLYFATKTYKIHLKRIEDEGHIVLWPNFKHKEWIKYYCYSEYPHNGSTWQSLPIVENIEEKKYQVLSKDQVDWGKRLIGIHEVSHDFNYEIYESKHPFVGIELQTPPADRGEFKKGGLILVKNEKYEPHKDTAGYGPVNIGFDFGSNNTCIAYSAEGDTQAHLIEFKNRRISFFSKDEIHNVANIKEGKIQPFEMLFFPNEGLKSNKIKSILSLHDSDRIIPKGEKIEEVDHKTVVKGGFPSFEKNLIIANQTDSRYTLKTEKDLSIDMVYNMKWSLEARENSYKVSFLRNLLLMTYVELFQRDSPLYPTKLYWALPSAMPKSMVEEYDLEVWSKIIDDDFKLLKDLDIYHSQSDTRKLSKENTQEEPSFIRIEQRRNYPITESIAVAKYAINAPNAQIPEVGTYNIGLDIGGSTTDILAITSIDGSPVLVKQSSIRLAAGNIAEVIKGFPGFKSVLVKFIKENRDSLNFAMNIDFEKNITDKNVSFYYNLTLDKLSDNKLELKFYKELSVYGKPIFAINLYITGLIMCYTGMLAKKIRNFSEKHKEKYFTKELENVKLSFYGTGSKMFNWYYSIRPEEAKNYYENCFVQGYGDDESIKIKHLDIIMPTGGDRDIKVEVAMGLASQPSNKEEHSFMILENNSVLDIVGDEGYILYNDEEKTVQKQKLTYLDEITPLLIKKLANQILRPDSTDDKFQKFKKFIELYFEECNKKGFLDGIDEKDAISAIDRLNIFDILKKDSGYNHSPKDFIAPLLILEGQGFMKDFLIPKLKGQK